MNILYRKMKRWYYNISIPMRLNITSLISIVVPMLLLALATHKVASDILIDRSIDNSLQELNTVVRGIDSLFGQVAYISRLVVASNDVQDFIDLPPNRVSLYLESRIRVTSSLDDMVGSGEIITAQTIVTRSGYIAASGNVDINRFRETEPRLLALMSSEALAKGELLWDGVHPVDYLFNRTPINCISVYRAVLDGESGEMLGVLQIDIEQSIFARILPESNVGMGDAFIVDHSGQISIAQDTRRLFANVTNAPYYNRILHDPTSAATFDLDGASYLVNTVAYAPVGWTVVRLIPLAFLTQDSDRALVLTIAFVLVCIALAVLIAILTSRAITRPLVQLANDMSHAGQGDMLVRSSFQSNDEVGDLARTFNTMMDQISDLMEKLVSEQRKKREYELMVLQAQIKPHFLYNTLEGVCSLALSSRNTDVVTMVKSLALFYRSVLSKGRSVISIREELDNIAHYLVIQKMRYGDKFDYRIDVPPALMNRSIVKLSLQPLVENAIYHGIKQKRGRGMITIEGAAHANRITISIIDDGVGFRDSNTAALLLSTESFPSTNGYGMRNVHERIRLYFGAEYGLEIDAALQRGTRVNVLLPNIILEPQN